MMRNHFGIIADFIDSYNGFSDKENSLQHDIAKLAVIKKACFDVVCTYNSLDSRRKQLKKITSSEFSDFRCLNSKALNWRDTLFIYVIENQNILALYLLIKLSYEFVKLMRRMGKQR
jgi:hypothetical protein